MRPWNGLLGACAVVLAAGTGTANAAWNNVFQTCCHSCKQPATSSFFAPAPAPACPSVSYVQRCYYQPVTCYRMQTTLVPVTTYRTSYYYEPVTSYRYTSYYDPCTGCCQQVATPCTSYRLRSQCNAVQSYVQRCNMVPVTTYRQSCYLEPVITYSAPACPTPCPTPCSNGVAPPVVSAGPPTGGQPIIQNPPQTGQPPVISENPGANLPPQNIPPASDGVRPMISENPGGTPPPGYGPKLDGSSFRPNVPRQTPQPPLAAPYRPERTASLQGRSKVQGQVVYHDRITPRGNARIVFVSAQKQGPQQAVTADPTGRFDVTLPAGDWLMYVPGSDGKPEFHSQLQLRSNDSRLVTVVSR